MLKAQGERVLRGDTRWEGVGIGVLGEVGRSGPDGARNARLNLMSAATWQD